MNSPPPGSIAAMRFLWGALAVAAVCAACARQEAATTSPPAAVDSGDMGDTWTLRMTAARAEGERRLFNGTLGVRIPQGHADARKEGLLLRQNRLLRLEGSFGSLVTLDGQPLAANGRFEGTFDLRDGTWRCRWEQASGTVTVTWLLHPTKEHIARRIEVTAGRGALRVQTPPRAQVKRLAWVSDLDRSQDAPTVSLRSTVLVDGAETPSEAAMDIRVTGRTVVVEDLIAFDGAPAVSFDALHAEASGVWEARWRTDIEIEGPIEDQRAIRACLFQLYAGGNAKLPPFGTSNAKYGGHRFWDAEAWMLPVYALIQPEVARAASDWRARTASEQLPGWETGGDGSDVTPPSHRAAIHIWGWVHWWLERAQALGLLSDPEDARRAMARVEEAFLRRAERTDRGLEFRSVIPPDEGRPRDNDLITNLLARRVLSRRHPESAAEVVLPRGEDGLPTSWDGDHLKGYQQTSALLALYPLEWRLSRHEAEGMFERYADLTSLNGPAMGDSIHATIAARFASSGGERSAEWSRRAYELWQESWQPFLDPAGGFSERRRTREISFLTGAAGCLQAVIYGFAGLRLVPPGVGAEGETLAELTGGWRLAAQPALPPSWRSVTLRGVWLLGRQYTIRATRAGEVSMVEEG